jgi:dipeptidyl aminopeptidase/acylaminoacyl peptidase
MLADTGASDQGAAVGGNPISVEEIVSLKTMSQLAMSPDGALLAYVLGTASHEGDHPNGQIYVVDMDGAGAGQPRQFTAGPGMDAAPHWAPDGQSLAFLSDREERGKPQLYTISRHGGEARRLSLGRGAVGDPSWSPGGDQLAYLMAEPESEERQRRKRERDDAVVASEAARRQRLWLVARDGTAARPRSPADRHIRHYAWSPSGDRIAAITTATPEANKMHAARLVIYPVASGDGESGAGQEVGPALKAQSLVWSRDGRTLYALGSGGQRPATFLCAWPLDGATPREPTLLLGDLPASPFWLDRARDRDELLLAAYEGLRITLFRTSAGGERAEPLLPPALLQRGSLADPVLSSSSPFAVSSDGRRLALLRSDVAHADELWIWEIGGEPRRLTEANPWLRHRRHGRQEAVAWTSFDGQEIAGLLIKPPDYVEGRRYPLVVHLHGGPDWTWTDRFLLGWHDWGQWLAAAGLLVLLPNPRGGSGRGNAYTRANVGDLGGGDYRDVLAGVDALIAQGLVDGRRLGIGGWSYGGALTSWAIGQTERFRCAVVGAGICDWISMCGTSDIRSVGETYFVAELHRDAGPYWERSPLRYAANIRTPTLILHGEADPRVPVSQGRELYSALRHMGVPCELVTYPREGHLIREHYHQRDLLTRVRDWFARYLIAEAE